MFRLLFFIFINFITIICSASNSNNKLQNEGRFVFKMGAGYDSSSNSVTSGQTCLVGAIDPKNIYIANPVAMIDFSQQQDLSILQSNLGVDVSSEFGGDRFSIQADAQFANSSKDNAYSLNFIYLYKYAGAATFVNGSLNQGDDALTPVARSIVHSKQHNFRELCGDSFIEQLDAGALIAVKLSLAFKSHHDKLKFAAEVNGKYGLASISAAIKNAASNDHIHVNFSLSAFQRGGDPQKLNDIFGTPSKSGNYPFIDCGDISADNNASIAACNLMISNIISYGITISKQLSSSDGTIDLKKLYYSNPMTTKYTRLNIISNAVDPSPEVFKSMRYLTKLYDKTLYDYNFTNHYLSSLSDKLDASVNNSLTDAQEKLKSQLGNIFLNGIYHISDCYRGYISESCVQIKDNITDALKDYALVDNESGLIDYLENNSYIAPLYVYKGGDPDQKSSYELQSNCILVPISTKTNSKYTLNCDGTLDSTLSTPDILKIKVIEIKGIKRLAITNLSYWYLPFPHPDNTLKQLVQYPDIIIYQDPEDVNTFSGEAQGIKMGTTTRNDQLTLTRQYQNRF